MDFTLRNITKGEISLLELYSNEGTPKKPLVLLIHGYLCIKEELMPQAYNLARHGFFVVLPDAYGHGERNVPGPLCSFFESALKTTGEINFLIESYGSDTRVDITKVGLTGFSMGGCITFNYLTGDDKRIKAAVPVIGTPDWVSIMKTEAAKAEMKANGLIDSDAGMEEYIGIAAQVEPLNRFTVMKDTPLLILNGDVDPIIPVDAVKNFYERLKALYACDDDIRMSIYRGLGHVDNLQMNMEMAGWFVKYLKP